MDHDRHEQQVEEQLNLVEGADVGEPPVGIQEEGVIGRHGAPGEDREDELQGGDRTEVDGIVLEDGVRDAPNAARIPRMIQRARMIWAIRTLDSLSSSSSSVVGTSVEIYFSLEKSISLPPQGSFHEYRQKNGKNSSIPDCKPPGWGYGGATPETAIRMFG
jgi:hypothetical protein